MKIHHAELQHNGRIGFSSLIPFMHDSLYPFRWVITGTILASLAVLTWWGWVSPRTSNCILPKNGAWISVDWTSQSASQEAIAQLARDASTRNIHYLFPFTTYLKPDGTFSPSYDYAADFVSRFHGFEPEIQVLAWIGIPLKNKRSIGVQGWVDLADPATRQKIVTFVAKLMEQAEFDGVHLNGVAIYADWEFAEKDWQLWQEWQKW